MKKFVSFMAILLLLGGLTFAQTSGGGGGGQGGGCVDTDGGKNLYVKGISAGIWDSCLSDNKILERWCTDGTGADYTVDCPLGYICNDGACVASSSSGGGGSGVPSSSGGGGGGEVAPSAGGGGGGTATTSGGGVVSTSTSTIYSKTCTYIWDSTPYLGQRIEIMATITDKMGNKASNGVSPLVVESNPWIAEVKSSPMSGKSLEIRMLEPKEGEITVGAVEIKIYAQSPYELGEMTLSFLGENLGEAFPISNKNCVAGTTSGGGGSGIPSSSAGGGGSGSCEKYYTCEDGTEVQYCFIQKFYNENGEVTGVGCGCKTPRKLCPQEDELLEKELESEEEPVPISSAGGGGSGVPSSSAEGGGVGSNETPVICNGCILGDKCVPIGYRKEGKYCDINGEFKEQKLAEESCDNNFECKSNVCVDGECISGGLLRGILNWLRKLFG